MAGNKKTHNPNSLRFRQAKTRAEKLGQVPTPPSIAQLLASSVPADARRILDLGAGKGALAGSVLRRCLKSRALLVDIDAQAMSRLEDIAPSRTTTANLDVLRSPIVPQLRVGRSRPDVVVSNPPYAMARLGKASIDRVRCIFPEVQDQGGWLRSDVVFAAHAWSLLGRNGSFALIVASPIVTQPAFASVRRQLISGLSNLTVTQLEPKTFEKAEVDAFLITGRKTPSRGQNVTLQRCSQDGVVVGERAISIEDAMRRMDFGYHEAMTTMNADARHVIGTLATLQAAVIRGSRSKNQYAGMGLQAFHTSHFTTDAEELHLTGGQDGFQNAYRGDILVARVGSRCLTRQARVTAGEGLFTDCVYRIRVPDAHRALVWSTLNSDFGREWRQAHAVGNCAKHLTVGTLLTMPVLA
ncbi:methyltransferase [Burkholderia cepacia]|uniref:site-specific DNA-methyltransferase (adenine-specific) n=1 Tax=Burkholderia cepacia GG4 TaxID=1009846 RepID=A0A9W3K1L9_BURCE|nr:methyltransferase [Burkholderia cepacia]AFQ47017.1 N6 adenine-specific DNA methyltransferase, N12 class [Burkholderia cepacia GG4]